jgi:hypothetical protein
MRAAGCGQPAEPRRWHAQPLNAPARLSIGGANLVTLRQSWAGLVVGRGPCSGMTFRRIGIPL